LTISIMLSFFIISEIKKNSANLVSAININVEEVFNKSTKSLDEIYHLYSEMGLLDVAQKKKLFDIFKNSDSSIEGVMVLNQDGKLVDGDMQEVLLKGMDYSFQPFVKNIPQIGDLYWTGVSLSQKTGQPTAYLSKRFENYIVVIQLNLKDISRFIEHFTLSQKSEIAITDASGIYLINNDLELVKSRSYDWYIKYGNMSGFVKYKNNYYLPYVSEIQGQGWKIIVYQSLSDYLGPTASLLGLIILVSTFLIFFINWLNFRSLKVITQDLHLIEEQALEISEGNYDIQYITSRYIEIDMLSHSFAILIERIRLREEDIEEQNLRIMLLNEDLEKLVAQRTKQLLITNEELTEAYSHLKEVQGLIVQNEKLAALGQMVSGVAHEMNTPIGNAFTASTYIRSLSTDLASKVQGNTIKRTEFLESIADVESGADIIYRNLLIASDLIYNFKQISTDHQSMELKIFNLYETINNIVISYGIDFKNANVTIELVCNEELEIRTYPGAVVHIVSNLIRNALIHGFEGREKGHIWIEVFENDDRINLLIKDDGNGMDQETLNQIYDPFFTTKRSRGGTGLGLNIVHNMITNILQGSVVCESEFDKGTTFKIQIPKQIVREFMDTTWT
jgi:signal transduction histidine kinase